jgi:hypothetical protein
MFTSYVPGTVELRVRIVELDVVVQAAPMHDGILTVCFESDAVRPVVLLRVRLTKPEKLPRLDNVMVGEAVVLTLNVTPTGLDAMMKSGAGTVMERARAFGGRLPEVAVKLRI